MGSTFSDFLGQLPAAIFVPFCASALLLVVVMALIVRARTRRSAAPDGPKPKRKHSAPADTSYDPDLPDLEMLIGTPVAPPPPAPPAAPAPPRPVQPGAQPVALGDGSTVQAVEVLRVLRDVVGGGLVVQMGDRAHRTLADSGAFRADFLQIMRELSPLVRSDAPAAPAADDAPEAPAALGALLAVREPKPSYPLPPTDSSGEMPGDLPRLDQSIALPPKSGLFRRKKPDAPPIPDLNIAGAVEAYVQHKLQFTPDLAGRSIHIHPAPGGGVLIETDGAFYETVDAVDDDDVRYFLSTAIREWQQRQR